TPETKNPTGKPAGFLLWRRPTLARPVAVLPSGLQRFTSVFGMGTGGTTALVSPECGAALAGRYFRSDAGASATLWRLRAIEVNRHYLNFERTINSHLDHYRLISLTSTYRSSFRLGTAD